MQTSIGTSGAVVAPIERPRVDPAMRIHSFNHAVADTWYLMGVVLSAGAALDWFRRALSGPGGTPPYIRRTDSRGCRRSARRGRADVPALPDRRAHAPRRLECARGLCTGMHTGHHRGHLTRAVMEGVVFALRDSLELMRRLRVAATEAVAVGGGARSSFWRRMQADALGTCPWAPWGHREARRMEPSILAAVGSGGFSSVEEACRFVDSATRPHRTRP